MPIGFINILNSRSALKIKMPKYKRIPIILEATQWFKNGDHPQDNCETFISSGMYVMGSTDPSAVPAGTPFKGEGKVVRYFRHPSFDGDQMCENCMRTLHVHGWIDQPGPQPPDAKVCPGDYIVTGYDGKYYRFDQRSFENNYQLIEEVVKHDA